MDFLFIQSDRKVQIIPNAVITIDEWCFKVKPTSKHRFFDLSSETNRRTTTTNNPKNTYELIDGRMRNASSRLI